MSNENSLTLPGFGSVTSKNLSELTQNPKYIFARLNLGNWESVQMRDLKPRDHVWRIDPDFMYAELFVCKSDPFMYTIKPGSPEDLSVRGTSVITILKGKVYDLRDRQNWGK